MKKLLVPVLCILSLASPTTTHAASAQILGWNNLGMHCMDSDYSVFSILPPYNTIEAQLIVGGALVTASNGYSVTYEAVADPDGSINTTSIGKGNWSQFDLPLYGADLAPDTGLLGWKMPGSNNIPQKMWFEVSNTPAPSVDTLANWWRAEGIPLTPHDDAGIKNPYPLMRLIARNSSGTAIATNDIVLPISDEMDCRACHASGTQAAAEPSAGWVWSANPERDYRLNILRKHDESRFQQMGGAYTTLLATNGFNPQGLYRTVVADGRPVLCAKCHLSEALPGTGVPGVPPLTEAVHSFHAHVTDPDLLITLDNAANRAACYRCHPGSATKCLRGAMGGAIAADGSMEMQCQSCHGNLSQVGSNTRVGWFMEPNCQSCHTGTATSNSGQIRYTSVFTDTNWTVRAPANQTFATQPNIPATGLSLYRFSAGHGGLQCSACHGSTHAEFPSTHRNDNLRNERIQGHAGVMVECTACHATSPSTITGGPHGMHPVGQTWVSGHESAAGSNPTQCQACHGTDYRGTVLSRMQADRTLSAFGTKTLFRGAIIGCYTCHNGPGSDSGNLSAAPIASNVSADTVSGQPVVVALSISGTGATGRIISQPAHGSVGLAGNSATYFPDAGFVGTDTFTYAAYDGAKNSALATGTISVAQGPFSISAETHVPPSYAAGWAVPFAVIPTPSNAVGAVSYDWDFGDGSAHAAGQYPTHAFAPGSYNWRVISTITVAAGSASTTNVGTIDITEPALVSLTPATGSGLTLTFPMPAGDALLEETPSLDPPDWTVVTNPVSSVGGMISVTVPENGPERFYRLKQL